MGIFQELFLIILSLFANLKLFSASYSSKVFSLQVGDILKLQGGKAHYDYDYSFNLHFFHLCDVWSTVENYFQKIPRPPEKNPHSPENSKFASPHRFANTENFLAPPAERGERTLW